MKIRYSAAFAAVLILCLALTGCFSARRPVPSPAPAPAPSPAPTNPSGKLPSIPSKISKGQGVEPELSVYMKETGQKKTMKLEDYIMGVVAGEMDPNWSVNALAAQAILARTFTLDKIAKEGGVPARGADASTDHKEFQAYNADKINQKVRQAVDMTRGKVITYNGDYIHAWFYADSGGKTATAQEGLNWTKDPAPYVVPVDDSQYRNGVPAADANWTATFTTAEVAAAASKVSGAKISTVTSIKSAAKGPSGRVTSFEINGQRVVGNDFRVALGSEKLKSLLLDSEPTISGGKVTFKGKGYGHGVGMAQWGARNMADAGKSPDDIVRFYFRNVDVVQLYK